MGLEYSIPVRVHCTICRKHTYLFSSLTSLYINNVTLKELLQTAMPAVKQNTQPPACQVPCGLAALASWLSASVTAIAYQWCHLVFFNTRFHKFGIFKMVWYLWQIYLLFGIFSRKKLFTVWYLKFWNLLNKVRNLVFFCSEFGIWSWEQPGITVAYMLRMRA